MTDPAHARMPSANSQSHWVAVWDVPLRLWHWALAVFVLIAWFTPSTYDLLHRISGYTVIALLVFRLCWGIFGTRYARFRRIVPRLRALPTFMLGLTRGETGRYLGHNPAGAAMLVLSLITISMSALTGAMQVTVAFFGVWWVEDLHEYSSDAVMVLVVVHVAGTMLMSFLQRENLMRAMITGRKRRHH